jgi:hypothetical protein
MNLFSLLRTKLKFTAVLFIFLGVLMSYSPPTVYRAEAGGGGGPVFETNPMVWINQIKTLVETIAIKAYQYSLMLKETVLDGIAWLAINLILQKLSESIITWINSGFKGSPTFLQNIEQYTTEIADRVAGELIWGSELSFLCSPFQLDVRLALQLQYAEGRDFLSNRNQCTFSGVINNLNQFINGDFFAGGWNSWFDMTQRPVNNAYGELLLASTKLNASIENRQGQEIRLLDWGKGFLSMKSCQTYAVETGTTEICDNVTPGTAIENQLNNMLDSGHRRLIVADEINEIVSALFAQLVSMAFEGAGGLLGLTTNAGGSPGNYYQQISLDPTTSGIGSQGAVAIQDSLTVESNYYNAKQAIVTLLEDAASYKDDTYGAANTCHSGTLTTELQQAQVLALADIAQTLNNIAQLENMLQRYQTAATAEEKAQIIEDYLSLQQSGILHSPSDIVQVEQFDVPELTQKINEFKQQVDLQCNSVIGGGN